MANDGSGDTWTSTSTGAANGRPACWNGMSITRWIGRSRPTSSTTHSVRCHGA